MASFFRMRRIAEAQEGVAIVEMALFLAVFSFVIIALIDYGTIVSSSVELSNATRIGIQVAVKQPTNTAGITQSVQNGSTLPPNNVSVATSSFCECDGFGVLCSITCAGTMAEFVGITASYNVPLLLNYPAVTNPFPLSKTVAVRVQ